MKKKSKKKYIVLIIIILVITGAIIYKNNYSKLLHHKQRNVTNADVYLLDGSKESYNLKRIEIKDLAQKEQVYTPFEEGIYAENLVLGTYDDQIKVKMGKIFVNNQEVFADKRINKEFIERNSTFKICKQVDEEGKAVKISGECSATLTIDPTDGKLRLMNLINGKQDKYQQMYDVYKKN